jgi:hypothetical protein
MNMKKNTLLFCTAVTCAAAATLVHAVDRTWDGEAGDDQWGSALNWSGNTMPGTGDRAIIVTNGIVSASNRIFLGDNRAINTLYFGGAGNNVILDGEGVHSLRLGNGSIGGPGYPSSSSSVMACDLILGASGSWAPADNWNSTFYIYGDVTDEDGDYGLTFPGQQNRNIVLGGHVDIGGTITIQNYRTRLGAVYVDSMDVSHFGGSVTNSAGIVLDCRLQYSDNDDTLLTIENAHQADSDRLQAGVPVVTVRSGGSLTFKGNATNPVEEHVSLLDLQSGRLSLAVNGANSGVATDFVVAQLQRASGTAITLTLSTGGRLRVAGAANTHGTWQPWCLAGSYYTKVGDANSIVSTVAGDYGAPAAIGNSPTALYDFAAASLTLGETASVWGLRWSRTSAQTLDLGTYGLTIGSGAMIVAGSLNKRITSSGGVLTFGGEDVVYYVDGSGSFTNSAPVAWSKPEGSSYTRPSLIFVRASRTDGVVFDGQDLIGNYDALYAQSYNTARRKITFGGPSDRTFNGPLSGLFDLEKVGPGALTFAGPNYRRTGGTAIKEGRVILAHASAPTPTVTNAVCEVAADIVFAATPVVQAGSTLAGLGTFGATMSPVDGIRIAPGSRTEVGGLVFGNQFSPAASLGFDIRIDAATNDYARVVSNFNKPASGSTFTFRVSDLSNGAAQIKGRDFVVLRWGGTLGNPANVLNFVVESGTPTKLDATEAIATLDATAKTITISGLKSVPNGTLMLVR